MEILTLKTHNGDLSETESPCSGGRVGGTRQLPILSDVGRGRPAEGVVVPAIAHVDAGCADGHADPVGLVVDGDGAKVGVEFVLVPPLGADQLTVHHQAYGGGQKVTNPTGTVSDTVISWG